MQNDEKIGIREVYAGHRRNFPARFLFHIRKRRSDPVRTNTSPQLCRTHCFLSQQCFRRPLFLCSPLSAYRRVLVQAAASVQ